MQIIFYHKKYHNETETDPYSFLIFIGIRTTGKDNMPRKENFRNLAIEKNPEIMLT